MSQNDDDHGRAAFLKPVGPAPRRPKPDPAPAGAYPLPPVRKVLGGRYELLERIGRGGMGEVHLARDRELGRKVAVKLVHGWLSSNEEFRAQFVREARVAASVSHRNVVQVFDFQRADGELFLVMELLDGRRLDEHLRVAGPLSPREAVRIVAELLLGVQRIHDEGIVHRDLKPSNVMIGPAGEVKIIDFGLGRRTLSGEPKGDDPTLTQIGAVKGTPRYMSPEQAEGKNVDGRSDVYAAGVILFELLTGRVPHDGAGPASIISKKMRDPVPRFEEVFGAWVPPDLHAVVRKAMAMRPEDRYATAEEMRQALEGVRYEGKQYASRSRQATPVLALVGAFAALALVLAMAVLKDGPSRTTGRHEAAAPAETAVPPPDPVEAPAPRVAAPPPAAERTPAEPPPAPVAEKRTAAAKADGCALFNGADYEGAIAVLSRPLTELKTDELYCLCGSYSRLGKGDEVQRTCLAFLGRGPRKRGQIILAKRWLKEAK